jgi:hypothetical protein
MAPSIAQEPVHEPEIQVKHAFDEKAHQGVSPPRCLLPQAMTTDTDISLSTSTPIISPSTTTLLFSHQPNHSSLPTKEP